MKNWNNNFDEKRVVNGKIITIGQQDFDNDTIMIKESNGNILDCPIDFDDNGDCYFIYDLNIVYISEWARGAINDKINSNL